MNCLLISLVQRSAFILHRLFRRLPQLALAHHRADASERLLLAADCLDRVNLAERELEVEAEERLLQALRFFLKLRVRHVVQALQLVVSLHKLNRAPFLLGPRDELALDRKLLRRKRHGLARHRFGDALDLVEHASGLDDGDPVVGRALALAHARLGGLLRNGLIGEHANPDFAAALDVSRHGDTRGLYLPGGFPPRLQGLPTVLTEADLAPPRRNAPPAA